MEEEGGGCKQAVIEELAELVELVPGSRTHEHSLTAEYLPRCRIPGTGVYSEHCTTLHFYSVVHVNLKTTRSEY